MAQDENPGICFVSGAWHTPSHYDVMKTKLEEHGFQVLIPKLPTCSNDGRRTWKDDVAEIQRIVTPHMDQGKEFIIVAHSYGGIPGCCATQGYTTSERLDQGKRGGFRAIVFVTAFVIPKPEMNLLETIEGRYPPWMICGELYKGNQVTSVTKQAKDAFYNDLPDEDGQRCYDTLSAHSQDAFETPVDFVPSQLLIPSTYLLCEGDAALALQLQESMAASVPGIKLERCTSGHSPFMSQPDRVIEILRKL